MFLVLALEAPYCTTPNVLFVDGDENSGAEEFVRFVRKTFGGYGTHLVRQKAKFRIVLNNECTELSPLVRHTRVTCACDLDGDARTNMYDMMKNNFPAHMTWLIAFNCMLRETDETRAVYLSPYET